VLTQEQYWEVDKFYSKADSILNEARDHAKKFEYDLCVRRSQEAFELFLKTMFRFIEREYPQDHDISNEIYKVHEALKRFDFTAQKVAQIVHRNRTLGLWREKSFYGDERLGVTALFTEHEARSALAYAEELWLDCSNVKNQIWGDVAAQTK